MMKKLITAVMIAAKSIVDFGLSALMVQARPVTLAPPIDAMIGWISFDEIAVTIAVTAVPMTTATASSTTFPRSRKSLNPFSTSAPFGGGDRSTQRHGDRLSQ